jgi:hypothetical protein
MISVISVRIRSVFIPSYNASKHAWNMLVVLLNWKKKLWLRIWASLAALQYHSSSSYNCHIPGDELTNSSFFFYGHQKYFPSSVPPPPKKREVASPLIVLRPEQQSSSYSHILYSNMLASCIGIWERLLVICWRISLNIAKKSLLVITNTIILGMNYWWAGGDASSNTNGS